MKELFSKSSIIKISAAVAVAAVALVATIALSRAVAANASAAPSGKLEIEVYDGNTNSPIEGATVVVIETGDTFKTTDTGSTGAVSLPIIADARYDEALKKPWGEVTLLCYKDGYVPYALFGAQVWEGQTRQGPRLYLFAEDSSDNAPFSIVEGPQRLWVNELIEQYRPKDA